MSQQSDPQPTDLARGAELALAVVVPMGPDPFLNTEDACRYLGVPKATLLTWRVRRPGYGPRAVKAGGRLKYRMSELDRWVHDHEESFGVDEATDEDDGPTAGGARRVRTRNRVSRVRSGPLRTAQP